MVVRYLDQDAVEGAYLELSGHQRHMVEPPTSVVRRT